MYQTEMIEKCLTTNKCFISGNGPNKNFTKLKRPISQTNNISQNGTR